jgi:spoIIIJ-associated protein
MEWIEVRARTLEEATERALDALGVHETELEVEVLEAPRSALFGLRRTEAHIRARVKPLSREKPQDRRRRRGREEQRARNPRSARGASSGESPRPASTPAKPKSKPAPVGRAAAADDTQAETSDDGVRDSAAASGSSTSSRRRRGGRNRSRRPAATEPGTVPPRDGRAAADTEETEEPTMADPAELEQATTRSRAFAVGLLDAFDLDADVVVSTDEGSVECAIDGDGLGVLVGARGATLAALEELLRDAVGHHAPSVRLHLDVAGYRARRREALAEFARRVAHEVSTSGSAKALEPMSAADRKVVHDAVAEIAEVATHSDGVEPHRRVVITPTAGNGGEVAATPTEDSD